jgi:hypothetical protein
MSAMRQAARLQLKETAMVTITVTDLTSGRYVPTITELVVETSIDRELEPLLTSMLKAKGGIFHIFIYYAPGEREEGETEQEWYLLFANRQAHGGKLRVVYQDQNIGEPIEFFVYRMPAKKSGNTFVYAKYRQSA